MQRKITSFYHWCDNLAIAKKAFHINTLRPIQNGRHSADDIFKFIFLNGNVWTLIKISLNLVLNSRISNIPALVQIMAWRRRGDKPLSEPKMVNSLTHICVTRPRWVNVLVLGDSKKTPVLSTSPWDVANIAFHIIRAHYNDVIMGAIAPQFTSLNIVYSTVYSSADQRKYQSSASLAFVRGIHRRPVNSGHKWPVTRKFFPFDDVIMTRLDRATSNRLSHFY